jgi:hypothetical protein
MDSGFSIDNHSLTCSKCHSTHFLIKTDYLYDHCECYNIRLVFCKFQVHISLLKEVKDFWYDYR